MKIVLPLEANKTDVCPNFGRAPYFMVVDQDTNTTEIHENAAMMAQGGAGMQAGQAVIDFGAQAVIASRIGENAFRVLRLANIELYQAEGRTARENIDAFNAGRLGALEQVHAGFHGKLWN